MPGCRLIPRNQLIRPCLVEAAGALGVPVPVVESCSVDRAVCVRSACLGWKLWVNQQLESRSGTRSKCNGGAVRTRFGLVAMMLRMAYTGLAACAGAKSSTESRMYCTIDAYNGRKVDTAHGRHVISASSSCRASAGDSAGGVVTRSSMATASVSITSGVPGTLAGESGCESAGASS